MAGGVDSQGDPNMGYFDVLTNGYFKTAQDGRKLFFPWGVLNRGYTIASEQDYLRLQQQIKIYMVVSLVLVISSASLKGDLVGLGVATLLIGFYAVWTRYLLHRLQRSDEKLAEIGALAFVGGGILIFIVDPGNRLIALVSIVVGGLAAAKIARMLMLLRRPTAAGPNPN
jgi:hypothetical protein